MFGVMWCGVHVCVVWCMHVCVLCLVYSVVCTLVQNSRQTVYCHSGLQSHHEGDIGGQPCVTKKVQSNCCASQNTETVIQMFRQPTAAFISE